VQEAEVAVSSAQVPLGTPAPDFELPDLAGRAVALTDFADYRALVVAFLCNHCPYVRHVEERLGEVTMRLEAAGGALVGICSNDIVGYPDDDVPGLVEQVARAGWSFPYLVDSEQDVALAFGAACTPDFFVYGPERTLRYRGAFDAASPGNDEPVDGALLRAAVGRVLAGEAVPEPHRPSLGCGIKWRTAP
jgi:peroxiredoxin